MFTQILKISTVLALLVFSPNLLSAETSAKESQKIQKYSHDILDEAITELANELLLYNKIIGINEEIAITSFVDLHQFEKTTHFGRTISEAFFDELFTRGFNVTDFRGQETISVNRNGEYFLTRDIKLLNKDVISAYILVGTYSYFEGKVQINARIIDNMSGKVLATARSNYNSSDCREVDSCKKARIIKIVKHGAPKKQKEDFAKADSISIDEKYFVQRKKQINKQQLHAPQKEHRNSVVQTRTMNPLVNLIK